MEFESELLLYICFFIGVVFVTPLIIGFFIFIAHIASYILAGLITIGSIPFVFIFTLFFGSESEIGNILAGIFWLVVILSTIIGFVLGIYYSIDIIKKWYKSWFL